jgi:putative peptide zinc metalloprotease protein
MAAPVIDDATVVTLYPLAVRADGREHVIGRVDTGTFVAVPAVGVRAIELLDSGNACGEARRLLREEDGDDIDVVDIARSLVDLGFVRTANGLQVPTAAPPRPHLRRVRSAHISWLFSRPALLLWAAVVVAGAISAAFAPEVVPRVRHYFWSSGDSLVVLGNAALMIAVMTAHELAHLFAARAHDLPARISISTRLVFLVAQTDVSAAWALPRRARYRIYLAGMAWDLWLLALALLVQAHLPLSPPIRTALQALALMLALVLLGQLNVYIRSDLYFVLLDLLRCRGLHHDALRYLRWRGARLLTAGRGRATVDTPLAELPTHEGRKVRVYALVVAVGATATVLTFFAFVVPIAIVGGVRTALVGVASGRPGIVADGLIAAAYQIALYATFVAVWRRKRGRQ